ncbi:hypothetical protein NDU88_003614 [Pleurodeles waltl]|uniref:Uncharacterized protein n=1 Tax=Pleurodeles waltl TaxID=8319 RepID=A0AAV7W420_PLEWA|nr:hypothetical protein NDU88_003614 [Pleurodeles waltl]
MKALPAYICGNHLPSSIARGIDGFIRSSLGDFGHNGRGFLIWTFVIFLPPRGKQRRMAPKAARGSRLKPGSQERRPLDPQPLVRGGSPGTAALETPAVTGEKEEVVTIPRMFKALHNSAPTGGSTTIKDSNTGPIRSAAELAGDGDSTGPGRPASSDSGGSLQVKTNVGSRFLDVHQTVSCSAGGSPQASVFCVGGNGLAAASEGEIDLPLYAPGLQSNVGLAQEVVSGAGYCEQVAAAAVCLLPSTDPSAPACTLEAIRDYRQGRVDLSAQGEVGENFFSCRINLKIRMRTAPPPP